MIIMAVDRRGQSAYNNLEDALSEKFSGRHIHHLWHILNAETLPISEYYGDESQSFGDKHRIGEFAASKNAVAVEQILRLRDTQFRRRRVNRTALIKFLNERGVPHSPIEEAGYKDLLLATYDEFYDREAGKVPESARRRVIARITLFEDRKDRTYRYPNRRFDFDDLDERIDGFIRRYNRRSSRSFDIRIYEASDRVVLHLFKEGTRKAKYVFKNRTEEATDEPGPPSITWDAEYPVKSIKVRLEHDDSCAEVRFSKDPETNGWTNDVETLLDEVFAIPSALSEEYQKRADSVDHIIDSVKNTSHSDEEDDEDNPAEEQLEDIEEEINRTLAEVADVAAEAHSEDKDSELDAEAVREWVDEIDPIGIQIENGMVAEEFKITSKSTLDDVVSESPGVNETLNHYISEANREDIAIKCRLTIPDSGRKETFVLQDGELKPDGGLSREAQEILNTIFDDHDLTLK